MSEEKWFAWHPIYVQGKWVWWKNMMHRCVHTYGDVWYEYKEISCV